MNLKNVTSFPLGSRSVSSTLGLVGLHGITSRLDWWATTVTISSFPTFTIKFVSSDQEQNGNI